MTATAIKRAALSHFARNGYEGTPLSDIAKEVGIKTPSLYAHFRSKEELFFSVFDDVLQEQSSRTKELIASIQSTTTEDMLYTILKHSCDDYLLGEEKVTFLKRAMLFPPAFMQDQLHRRFMESEQTITDELRDIFRAAISEGIVREEPLEDLIASYLCLMDGCFLQLFYYGRHDFERRLACVWRIFWDGITKTGTDRPPGQATPPARS